MPPTDDVTRIALCLHEAIQRVGVPAEEIYINIDPDLTMTVIVGPVGFPVGVVAGPTREDAAERWCSAVDWWNEAATDRERDALYADFQGRVNTFRLVEGIMQARALAALPAN